MMISSEDLKQAIVDAKAARAGSICKMLKNGDTEVYNLDKKLIYTVKNSPSGSCRVDAAEEKLYVSETFTLTEEDIDKIIKELEIYP